MDTYLEKSINEGTRRQRGGQPGPRTQLTSVKQKMPLDEHWIKYLNNGENKNNLVSFFVEYLKLSHVRENLRYLYLFRYFHCIYTINERKSVWKMSWDTVVKVFECNHEEADIRIPMHGALCSEDVVLVAKDTDIIVLLAYAYEKCSSVKQ